jgi:hypothetical protein
MANKASYWSNSDGLVVGFGRRDVADNIPGAVAGVGSIRQLVVEIVGANLTDTAEPTDFITGAFIPADSVILAAYLTVTTAFAGTNAVLDIGTYDAAGSAIDDDGIDAAIATATLVDNYYVACDGGKIGTQVTVDNYIAATYDTAAFTAGRAKLVIEYIPNAAS